MGDDEERTDEGRTEGEAWREAANGIADPWLDTRLPSMGRCLAHSEDEPCPTCAAYIAAGL